MFWIVYLVSVFYCIYKMVTSYRTNYEDPVHTAPALETLAIIVMAPVLMAVDVSLTWIRLYKEAYEVKKNREKIF